MDKKQQIIQAAVELFATQGYERTSISAVCERANASKGAVFHHFKNKDDLLRAVFIRIAENVNEVGAQVGNANESLPARERFINLLEQIFASMTYPEQKLYYQFDFQVQSQTSMRLILQDLIDARYSVMMDSFESILHDIPTANKTVDSHMLIAEIAGIALQYLFTNDEYPLEQIKERFIKKHLLLLEL